MCFGSAQYRRESIYTSSYRYCIATLDNLRTTGHLTTSRSTFRFSTYHEMPCGCSKVAPQAEQSRKENRENALFCGGQGWREYRAKPSAELLSRTDRFSDPSRTVVRPSPSTVGGVVWGVAKFKASQILTRGLCGYFRATTGSLTTGRKR